MKTCLAVFTCSICSNALLRHWPYFLNQHADTCFIVKTTDKPCDFPHGVGTLSVGTDSYIDGDHLPLRMIDTMEALLQYEWETLILTEYDTLFFNRIRTEELRGDVAGHLAGFSTWGSKAKRFYHNPWVFNRGVCRVFIDFGRKAIEEGVCGHMTSDAYGTAESSPDVFFGYVTQETGMEVQCDLWTEFSRNAFDAPGDLDKARAARISRVDIIHGVKHKHELDYILND